MFWRWVSISLVVTLLEPTRANRLEEFTREFDELSEPGSAAIPSEEEEEEDLHLFTEEDVLILTEEEAALVRRGAKGAGLGWWKRADGTSVAEEASKKASWGWCGWSCLKKKAAAKWAAAQNLARRIRQAAYDKAMRAKAYAKTLATRALATAARIKRAAVAAAQKAREVAARAKAAAYRALCPTRARLEPEITKMTAKIKYLVDVLMPWLNASLQTEENRIDQAKRTRTAPWTCTPGTCTSRDEMAQKADELHQTTLAKQLKDCDSNINAARNKLALKKKEMSGGRCSIIMAMFGKLVKFIADNLCVIVKWGMWAAAALADMGVAALITAATGGVLGPVIAAMQKLPFCLGAGVKNATHKALAKATQTLAQKAFGKAKQLGTAKSATLVSNVAGKAFCTLKKVAGPMSGGEMKQATGGTMKWATCSFLKMLPQLIEFGMKILCGQFVQAIQVLIAPLVLCNIEANGKKCQTEGCWR